MLKGFGKDGIYFGHRTFIHTHRSCSISINIVVTLVYLAGVAYMAVSTI